MLIFSIIEMHKAQSTCDQTMCEHVCEGFNMHGTCKGNECDCSKNEKCVALIEKTCEYLCNKLELKGVCDANGYCICKAELEICYPWKCQEQCLEDPRAMACEAAGGVVTAIGCLKYGPVRTCLCQCTLMENNSRLNKFNYFLPVTAKNTPEYYRYSVNNV